MHPQEREREREREREMGEIERQTDRKRCFNETHNHGMLHYDHSVWPASMVEGKTKALAQKHTHTHTQVSTQAHAVTPSLSLLGPEVCNIAEGYERFWPKDYLVGF